MSRDALVVGINKYPFLKDSATGNYKHLTTPATDAEAIAQLLETHGNFRVKRFPASNIDGKLQVDPDKLVKTEELEAAILDLFLPESGKPPETALLFFAGHGLRKQLRQSLMQGFLGTSDASPSKNLWGLSLRELWEILQQSQAQQQVIWLDCCFSGELLNFKDTEMGRHSSGCDRFLIAASRDYEVAYQQLDGKHGVLTGALLAGLNSHLVPEFEWITNRTLTVSVEQKLQAYYETTKIPQSPLISNHGEAIKLIQGRAKPHSQNQSDAKNFQNLRLEPHTINELVKLLRPFLEDERNRRPFLVLALGNDAPVLQHISWGGAVAIFIPDMVCKLADYGEVAQGKQALWALLEYVRSQVGVDVQQRIDNLRPLLDVRSRSDSFGVSPSSTATDTTSIDVLVQKVRDHLHDDIQRSHGTMPVLGVDHWVDNELLILMKHKIDNFVASSRIIQQFLEWIHEKSRSFKGRIRQTMARAFYYALTTYFEKYIDDPNIFNTSFIRNLAIITDMNEPVIVSEYFDNTFGKALDLERILWQPSDVFLGFALSLNFSYELKQAIQQLLNQVPSQFITNEHFEDEWWQQNQPEFIIKLRIIMVKYCNIGHDWQFSNRQKQLLDLYWDYNKFIVELLNKDNCISDQVREEIEDNLLLPIAEIEKRKRER